MANQSGRILYIEDEYDMIELVRLILGRKGFEVKGIANGRDGLAAAWQDPPDLGMRIK
jgi:DNA-binding response OmpR family regulator